MATFLFSLLERDLFLFQNFIFKKTNNVVLEISLLNFQWNY